ncbi:hypothetical protein [Faucicola atlantae]|uniref:hypothetical protein n=1 Tax=Faucicola atlantae TaxID=34059 RepID=UPI0025AEE530|nr:hypothetical protein [Moraxella atlantae]
MLTGLQKAKALKQLKQLRLDKVGQTGLALAKSLKRMKQLRLTLGMNDAPTYSTDNPFAQYANDDPEVKQNADDWENRKPLTQERLAAMNAMAQSMGYATYIEARHASLGTFQAEKGNGNRRAEIGGKFINNDGNSAKDASTDFELALYENGEIEDYLYTNDLNQALERGNDWLADGEAERITELTQILTDLQAGASPMRLDFAHIATLVDDDRDAANEIRAYLDTHWLSEVA